jgi:hypothetical protein
LRTRVDTATVRGHTFRLCRSDQQHCLRPWLPAGPADRSSRGTRTWRRRTNWRPFSIRIPRNLQNQLAPLLAPVILDKETTRKGQMTSLLCVGLAARSAERQCGRSSGGHPGGVPQTGLRRLGRRARPSDIREPTPPSAPMVTVTTGTGRRSLPEPQFPYLVVQNRGKNGHGCFGTC